MSIWDLKKLYYEALKNIPTITSIIKTEEGDKFLLMTSWKEIMMS